MSKDKSLTDIKQHCEKALKQLRAFLFNDMCTSDKPMKADKLAYWLQDYVYFLKSEPTFDPKKRPRYDRGALVKAQLGFRIGSEHGGLHYCIVIEDNPQRSPVVTVIPLTSLKPGKDLKKLRRGELFLGNELFRAVAAQAKIRIAAAEKELQLSDALRREPKAESIPKLQNDVERKIKHLKLTMAEIKKMKSGSIALLTQITTISKIRIADPTNKGGVLSDIKLSDSTLQKIDENIIQLFTGSSRRPS